VNSCHHRTVHSISVELCVVGVARAGQVVSRTTCPHVAEAERTVTTTTPNRVPGILVIVVGVTMGWFGLFLTRWFAFVFLVAGILLGLVFLYEFAFHVNHRDATHYEYLFLSSAGSIACFRAVFADWRTVRRADSGVRPLISLGKPSAVVFSVAGTLLGLLAALGRNRAPWEAYELGFAFPVVFALGSVACFRSALSDWRSPGRHPTVGSGLTPDC
jgi:hypothetical protein